VWRAGRGLIKNTLSGIFARPFRQNALPPFTLKATIPLENGMTYGFAKDVNIIWRHGIPQLSDKEIKEIGGGEDKDQGRISIIIWGYSDIIDV
jgi:hypothetical protein